MRNKEKRPTQLLHSTDDLRKLIMEHPDYPLLVLSRYNSNVRPFVYMPCGSISVKLGEFLDCKQDVDDKHCFTSRSEFEDSIFYSMYRKFDGSEQELELEIERKVMEFDSYWKPCIIVKVDN